MTLRQSLYHRRRKLIGMLRRARRRHGKSQVILDQLRTVRTVSLMADLRG